MGSVIHQFFFSFLSFFIFSVTLPIVRISLLSPNFKICVEDFTEPGLLKIRLTLTGLSLWFSFPSHVFMGSNPLSYLFTLHQTVTQNLSDVKHSTFEIAEAQLRNVTEMAPKSQFLFVNRSPIRTGAKV